MNAPLRDTIVAGRQQDLLATAANARVATRIRRTHPPTTTTGELVMRLARDTWLIFERSMWLTLRNPVWVFIGLMQPILYLVLFGPLLNSVAGASGFPAGGAYNVFVPGLLIQLAMFSLFVGFGLIAELRYGVVERMRVTPMGRGAMLLGRALRDVVILEAQAIVTIAVAIPFGLTVDTQGVLTMLGLLALIGLVTGPFSYALALWTRSEDALAPIMNTIVVPVLLLSGILLPMSLAPDWLQTIASFNPFSHAVSAARDLFNGSIGSPEVALGIGLMTILAAAAVWVASRAFSRAAA
jgi:ABC-2 type transport system permease protein